MSTPVALTFFDWLRFGQVMGRTAALRELWVEFLHTYGAEAAARRLPRVDPCPRPHDLSVEETSSVASAVPAEARDEAWCHMLVGAEPGVAVGMVRAGVPGRQASSVVPRGAAYALVRNPGVGHQQLRTLVGEGLLEVDDLLEAAAGVSVSLEDLRAWQRTNPEHPIVSPLLEEFGDDVGAWRLFFELREAGGEQAETIATVRAPPPL